MLVSNCATSGKKKFRFDKNQEPTGLLRDLGLKTSLYKVPVLSNVKKGIPFVQALSLENSADSYLCFRLALLHSVSFFDSISSNIDEIPSINPSTNVFDFADFNVHHKDWLTYSGGAIGLVNSAIISLSQMILLIWSNFLLESLTVILTVLIIWIYLFLLPQVFVLQGLSLHWEILIRLLSQFPSIFQ